VEVQVFGAEVLYIDCQHSRNMCMVRSYHGHLSSLGGFIVLVTETLAHDSWKTEPSPEENAHLTVLTFMMYDISKMS
jgi:hypothetical protein